MAATMLSMQTSRLAAGAARAAKPAGVTSSSVAAPRAAGVVARAEKQNLWYPGASPAPHLDPSTAGFRGFDPLGLAANKDLQKWMVEGELTNGRWAMAAVAGILFTDLFGLGDWWTAGAKPTPIPLPTLVAVEVAVFAFLEAKRFESWKKTGYGGVAGIAPFDPLGMDSPEMREKEVKNGRLAMLAFLGFSSVAAVRGLGPIEALKLHLGNPNVENIYTTKVAPEFTLAVFAGSITPMLFEARKTLMDKSKKEAFDSALPIGKF